MSESVQQSTVLGSRVRAIRSLQGISQNVLAFRSGISQGTISSIEQGTRPASAEQATALALGCGHPNPDEFSELARTDRWAREILMNDQDEAHRGWLAARARLRARQAASTAQASGDDARETTDAGTHEGAYPGTSAHRTPRSLERYKARKTAQQAVLRSADAVIRASRLPTSGCLLASLRQDAGLTRVEAAARLGVPPGVVRGLERCSIAPGSATARGASYVYAPADASALYDRIEEYAERTRTLVSALLEQDLQEAEQTRRASEFSPSRQPPRTPNTPSQSTNKPQATPDTHAAPSVARPESDKLCELDAWLERAAATACTPATSAPRRRLPEADTPPTAYMAPPRVSRDQQIRDAGLREGHGLRVLRAKRGLTRAALAQQAGVSRDVVDAAEVDGEALRREALERLCSVLEVSPEAIRESGPLDGRIPDSTPPPDRSNESPKLAPLELLDVVVSTEVARAAPPLLRSDPELAARLVEAYRENKKRETEYAAVRAQESASRRFQDMRQDVAYRIEAQNGTHVPELRNVWR